MVAGWVGCLLNGSAGQEVEARTFGPTRWAVERWRDGAGGLRCARILCALEQGGCVGVEGVGECPEDADGDVAFAALGVADVVAADTRSLA
jgi:hypothetical protein